MLAQVVIPMLLYRLRPTDKRLVYVARPLMMEPEELAIRQLGTVYQDIKLDTELPWMATAEELEGFVRPVVVFALEHDVFFPARSVLPPSTTYLPEPCACGVLEGLPHTLQDGSWARERAYPCVLASPEEN